jgi:hypothetical protein
MTDFYASAAELNTLGKSQFWAEGKMNADRFWTEALKAAAPWR